MNKKNILLTTCIALIALTTNAQEYAAKLNLSIGDKITFLTSDSVVNAQKRGEETMDMKTYSTAAIEYAVVAKTDDGYTLTNTLKKIKIDFEGFGQKMKYDSESSDKQEGMMAEQLKDKIGKSDTLQITMEGKKVDDETGEKGKGKKRGGGMMRMMDMQSTSIENAFLAIPAEAKEGSGWKKDDTKEGVRSQTIYFLDKISGNIAVVSFKKKTKGTKVNQSPQGEMKIEIDNLSEGNMTVEIKSGLVKTYNETTNSNSKMNMMGQDMPSTGKTITHVIMK